VIAAPPRALGTLRLDGASLECATLLEIGPDGAATMLCTDMRTEKCVLRTVDVAGNKRARSPAVSGKCNPAVAGEVQKQHKADFERCGAVARALTEIAVYPDGGLARFDVSDLVTTSGRNGPVFKPNPAVSACVRKIFEPAFACPVKGSNTSFTLL
jgi:hypothetical protein